MGPHPPHVYQGVCPSIPQAHPRSDQPSRLDAASPRHRIQARAIHIVAGPSEVALLLGDGSIALALVDVRYFDRQPHRIENT
jgi:hypothetical protein